MAGLQQDWLTFLPDPTSPAFKVTECDFDFSTVTRTLATNDTVLLFFETVRSIMVVKITADDPPTLLSDLLHKGLRDLRDRTKLKIKKIVVTDVLEWQDTILAKPTDPPKSLKPTKPSK
jgi:hypothetical protein